jgi:nicotinamide riboside kinase
MYKLLVSLAREHRTGANISVAMVGDISSGKSHYIAALIHQMRSTFMRETAKRVRLTCMTPEVASEFIRDYLTPLFTRGEGLL